MTTIVLIVVPGVPLHLLGLAIVPWSLAAARGGVRNARPREINAAIWAFALTAVVGASASGLGAVAAVGVVVACALATLPRSCSICRAFLTSCPTTSSDRFGPATS